MYTSKLNMHSMTKVRKSIDVLLCRIANRFVSRQGPQYKALKVCVLCIPGCTSSTVATTQWPTSSRHGLSNQWRLGMSVITSAPSMPSADVTQYAGSLREGDGGALLREMDSDRRATLRDLRYGTQSMYISQHQTGTVFIRVAVQDLKVQVNWKLSNIFCVPLTLW